VKEQTADASASSLQSGDQFGTRALGLESLPEAVRKGWVPALFVVLALLVTTGYGSGLQLNDGQASLHIDPLKFLGGLLHAWNPALYLGTHTGFWYPYETPYAWAYAAAQVVHVPQAFAQRAVVFTVYLGCLASMYYCLRSVAPWLNRAASVAGSCAYLFNMYVALNSQAQIVWLLTYATLPAMVGITARAMRGEMNLWRAALGIALLVLVGGGINPPLVAINVVVLAIFVVVSILFDPQPAATAKRTLPFIAAASIAAIAINLYWLVPFVDFFRGVWLNGVLSEAPSMHNAATSFDNVLRGLGHWATFVSFAGRPYFPWAAPYEQGLFSALLWFVPIVALSGIAFRSNQRPVTLYFLIVTIVSVPLVVGYYHDALGDAVTTPIYDAFYRNLPGFQMFRFSYKWVAGVEFGISALYALAAYAIVAAAQVRLSKLGAAERERRDWIVPALRMAFVVVPIVVFIPVLIDKMNYPGPVIPSWEYREKALVGNDQRQRVALFPTQFLEQFDWGSPEFYIEDSLVDRPMIYGLLGSEPSEGTDRWVRRAYRATREGLPFAGNMFRVLGADTFLQRDDFIPAIDFSSPGEWRYNTTTLTHDLLHRVLRASPARVDGPLHVYHLGAALPLVYGVTHPVLNTLPLFSDAYLGDVDAMAKGIAEFDPPSRSAAEFSTAMQSLSPILPGSAPQIQDLAVNQALLHGGIRIHPPSADVGWTTPFKVRSGGQYAIFALEQSLLFYRTPPQNLSIDGSYFSPQPSGGAWTRYGSLELPAGEHSVSDGYPDSDLVVAMVRIDDLDAWEGRVAALKRALPQNLASTTFAYGSKASITVPRTAAYRIRATAVGSFGPDGLVRAPARRGGSFKGAFPTDLNGTLPYVPADGVVGTAAVMMPQAWYRDDPTSYQWQRGDPISWLLFARSAHVRVFVPGRSAVDAAVSMRLSRLQAAPSLTVGVGGRKQRSVSVAGPAADSQAYDTMERLEGPAPVATSFRVRLHPGWNDVSFDFHATSGERSDLGREVVAAAVAPDLTFTRSSTLQGVAPTTTDSTFSAIALANPPAGLAGDPELQSTVAGSGKGGGWLAVALRRHGAAEYRVFPVPRDGSIAADFMHAFPNDWDDASRRVVGIWYVARGGHPRLSATYYNLRAMPGRALRNPGSLAILPIRVDNRAVGSRPLVLSRGSHLVTSADRAVKLGLLTVEPATLPKTQSLPLLWERRSPTAVNVTVKNPSGPFLLVFGEAYHPKWQATLDGVPLKHVIVDGVVNGWIVPALPDAGSTISLTFTDQLSYIAAAGVSLIGLILLIVLACVPQLWPIRSSNP
jgi:hypothetical protein